MSLKRLNYPVWFMRKGFYVKTIGVCRKIFEFWVKIALIHLLKCPKKALISHCYNVTTVIRYENKILCRKALTYQHCWLYFLWEWDFTSNSCITFFVPGLAPGSRRVAVGLFVDLVLPAHHGELALSGADRLAHGGALGPLKRVQVLHGLRTEQGPRRGLLFFMKIQFYVK